MKNLSNRLNVLITAIAVGLVVFIFAVFWAYNDIEISVHAYPEAGDQVIIKFPKWIPGYAAKKLFSIEPKIEGERVWLEEYKELSFLPRRGFVPGTNYKVSIGSPINYLAASIPIAKTFNINISENQGEIIPEPEILHYKYIDANLTTMTLTLFDNGQAVKTYPIAGKGNPKTSPTIEGEFTIKSKEVNHFSSLSHVWMPWSMQFEGDYFIHQWPYWPGGQKLQTKYSAGCVRLFEDHAKEVYDFAEIGMQFIVHSTPLIFDGDLEDGDIAREDDGGDIFLLSHVGEKYFRRRLPIEAINYQFFNGLLGNIKVVASGGLDRYQTSRWAQLPYADTGIGQRYIYEIDDQLIKHKIICNPNNCNSAWKLYGWDLDEIFIISRDELDYYFTGDNITLEFSK